MDQVKNTTSQENPETQRMIRLDIYVKKHPSITHEQFHKRWSKVHGSLVKGWLAEKGIYRYTQVRHSLSIMLRKLVEDNFFADRATPDQEAITDMGSVMRSIGYEEIHVENGKAVEV